MQDHFTLLRFSWTGGFGAPHYGGSPGLSGQAPLATDESEPDPATLRELRSATDLALRARPPPKP